MSSPQPQIQNPSEGAAFFTLKVSIYYCQSIQSPKLVLIFNPASCPTGKTTSLHYKHKTYIFFQKTNKKIINQVLSKDFK